MAGRSNLQQAVPITFGYKMATMLGAFERHRERLAQMRKRVEVGEFGGAAGTLSSLGKDGLKVQAALMKELKLGQPDISWHTVRDRIAEVGCFLGLVTGTCGKIAFDVKLLMQTEVEEVYGAVPRRPRLVLHHAAEAQSDLVGLHHRADRGGEAARRRAARGAGRGPRALDRPVGDRVDRAAGDLHARRPARWRRPASCSKASR